MFTIRIALLLLSCLLFLAYSCVQPPTDTLLLSEEPFTLVGDTLVSAKNLKIYPKQKFVCGKGSGENGWYKAISFKSPANWANLLWRDMEIKNNIDYQIDEGLRDKDKVKEFLSPGDTLVVSKIQKRGTKKYGYSYVVIMRQGKGILSLQYECSLAEALKSEEILLVRE